MKALIDTNIVLDFFCKRKGFYEDANIIFQHCFTDVDGVIAAHTVSNLFYILQSSYGFSLVECRTKIRNLCTLFEVEAVGKDTILSALDNEDFSDLEDSLQNECALSADVEYIVTRNAANFAASAIPVVSPKQFIDIVRSQSRA